MKLENQNILILSNEPWGDIWYSKHNYAYELSKKNKVFFLNPPGAFSLKNIFYSGIKENTVSPNITVLEYSNRLPVSLFNFWKLNDKIILNRLKKFFDKKKIHDLIFWTFDPIRLAFPEILNPKLIIVHAVDDYLFSYPSESMLAQKADHVFCVSNKFVTKYKGYNKNITVLPHAIPDDEFITVSHKRNGKLKGVFIGKMDSRIDAEFNLSVFKSFPEIEFKIIGLISDEFRNLFKKENLSNVILIPPVKSSEIKKHVSTADFCFIFKKMYDGNNISSHKLLQYLAQGKPIFGTDFSDMTTELKNALYLSNNPNEIIKMLSAYSDNGEPTGKSDIRVNYTKQHTFSKTISVIENALKLTPKSNTYLYYGQNSIKTRFLNFFRKALANPVIDPVLANFTQKKGGLRSFALRIVPPEYLYKNPSYRNYNRNGIKMNLNISNLVDHYVYYSTDQTALDRFISHLKPNYTVIDIGANIGYTTLLFSKACPEGKILSIEPSRELFKTVTDHVSLNEIKNVKCLNIGLGEKEKTVQLYKVSESNSGMNRVLEEANASFASESITIKTLDEVAKEQSLDSIHAIKIDVEGYEYKILKGAYTTLKTQHPILLVELDDFNLKEQQSNPKELLTFLFELNYSIYEADSMKEIDLSRDYTGVHFDIICFKKTG